MFLSSPSTIRTYNQTVNSRPLCRWAIREYTRVLDTSDPLSNWDCLQSTSTACCESLESNQIPVTYEATALPLRHSASFCRVVQSKTHGSPSLSASSSPNWYCPNHLPLFRRTLYYLSYKGIKQNTFFMEGFAPKPKQGTGFSFSRRFQICCMCLYLVTAVGTHRANSHFTGSPHLCTDASPHPRWICNASAVYTIILIEL